MLSPLPYQTAGSQEGWAAHGPKQCHTPGFEVADPCSGVQWWLQLVKGAAWGLISPGQRVQFNPQLRIQASGVEKTTPCPLRGCGHIIPASAGRGFQ